METLYVVDATQIKSQTDLLFTKLSDTALVLHCLLQFKDYRPLYICAPAAFHMQINELESFHSLLPEIKFLDGTPGLFECLRPLLTHHRVVVCPADTIFEEQLIKNMADPPEDGEIHILIEPDLEGMVGLPTRQMIKVAYRPLLDDHRILKLGKSLDTYGGLFTGLYCLQQGVQLGVDLESTLIDCVARKALGYSTTRGETWVAVLSKEAMEFAENQLCKIGHKLVAGDRTFLLLGRPKELQSSFSGSGNWAEFSVNSWRSAVFTTKSYFAQLYDDTTDFLMEAIHELYQETGQLVRVVEVGCGTGEALIPLCKSKEIAECIGVDINSVFIDFCQASHQHPKLQFMAGDGFQIDSLLEAYEGPTLVTCVGNTLGVMPEDIRSKLIDKMASFGTKLVLVLWNSHYFGDAIQHFYHANPSLCGPFEGKHVNFDTHTLITSTQYKTHWTSEVEAIEEIRKHGLILERGFAQGKGVLVRCHLHK